MAEIYNFLWEITIISFYWDDIFEQDGTSSVIQNLSIKKKKKKNRKKKFRNLKEEHWTISKARINEHNEREVEMNTPIIAKTCKTNDQWHL